MSDFLEVLTHGRRFKAAVKELSLDELITFQQNLAIIIETREHDIHIEQEQNAEKNAQIAALRQQMADLGISADELVSTVITKEKKKRAPRPPKYKIDVDGETVTWTGQGRMPTVFKNEIDAGFDLSKFLI